MIVNGVLIMANNIKGINHVGLTVPNIEEATEFLKMHLVQRLHMMD